MPGALLKVTGVDAGYGPLQVLRGIDFELLPGEIALLVGLNGAGKTTTALTICGALPAWDGSIWLDGKDVTSVGTKGRVGAGVVLVPEGGRLFPDLTVEQNLQVGSWSRRHVAGWLETQLARVYERFPEVRHWARQRASTLSGGQRQLVAICRALMSQPRLLILDEPFVGLSAGAARTVLVGLRDVAQQGTTILCCDCRLDALPVASTAMIISQGCIVETLVGQRLLDAEHVEQVLLG